MRPRRALLVAAALAAAGIAVAAALVREHVRAHHGLFSFCAINDLVNCDTVATSRWSVWLGLPVAVWGVLWYVAVLLLALSGLRSGRPHPGWPTGLLTALGAAATVVAFGLAAVSEFLIGALCVLCATSWVLSAGIFATACRAAMPGGIRKAVRSDLAILRARPWLAAGVVAGGAALVVLLESVYPHYWERPRRAAASAAPVAFAGRSTVVVEFSDYACPFCARAHQDAKVVLAERPDLHVVHRNFPLDPSCNPAVKRMVHPGACALARAGICAEAQGKLAPMADALFDNQREGRPVETLAREAGLDAKLFAACLSAPETQRRLESDVADGIAAGLRATPTWIVNGVPYVGEIPVPALPPPRAAAR